MLVILFAAAFLLAALMLVAGVRGRRIDDHPLCRRCGYDLTGRHPDASRCPECGADMSNRSAIRVGHRTPSRRVVAVAMLLIIVSGVGGGTTAWLRLRGFDPLPYQPLWWLRHRIAGSITDRDIAFSEVARRAAWLRGDQLAPFVDKALTIQAQPTATDTPAFHLIEAAHAANKLPHDQWVTYAIQAYTLGLVTRPVLVPGDSLPTLFPVRTVRLDDAKFMVQTEMTALSLDGRPVALTDPMRQPDNGMLCLIAAKGSTTTGAGGPWLTADLTTGLSPGPHLMAATVRLSISEPNPAWGGSLEVAGNPYHPLGSVDLPVTASFKVDPTASFVNTDPSLRAAVQAGLTVDTIKLTSGRQNRSVQFTIHWRRPPARLRYRAWVRPPGGQAILANDTVAIDAGSDMTCGGFFDATTLVHTDRVNVIFVPAPELACRTLDPAPIWGGTVVVHDVPVHLPGRAPATWPTRVDGSE
jgi:hypothetical protein